MKIVKIDHIQNHVVFTLWEQESGDWYETIQNIDGSQYGLYHTKLPRVSKAELDNYDIIALNYKQQREMESYQIIADQVPQLKNEGQALAIHGAVVVPGGSTTYPEGVRQCGK